MVDRKKVIILEDGRKRLLKETEEISTVYQFSFKKLENRNITIPSDQQMIVVNDLSLDDDITIEGDLCLI